MNTSPQKNSNLLFILTWLLLAPFHLKGLDWGTPSPLKSQLVFDSPGLVARLTPEMLSSRSELYQHFEDALSAPSSEVNAYWATRSIGYELHPWQEISRAVVVGFMRGYLLGVPSDDQQTLASLSHFKPWKGQFDTLNYTYGWFYQVAVAVWLGLCAVVGYLPRTLRVADLLLDPDGVARMYLLARSLSGISLLLSAYVLYRMAAREMSKRWGAVAAFFLLASPLAVTESHLAKPHAFATLLLLLALWNIQIYLCSEHPDQKNLLGAGVGIGLASAAAITNWVAFAAVPLTLGLTNNRKPFSQPILWKTLGLGTFAAILLNPFVFMMPGRFLRRITYDNVHLFGAGKINIEDSVFFLKTFFTYAIPLLAVPLILWGAWKITQKKHPFGMLVVTLMALYLALDTLWMRHQGVGFIILPLAAWLFTYGAIALWESVAVFPAKALALLLFLAVPCLGMLSQDGILLQRYRRVGNLTDAGIWANQHIPPGSSVGILNGNINPASVPPFHFLRYRLVMVPDDPAQWTKSEPRPAYLILNELYRSPELLRAIERNYVPCFYRASLPTGQPASPYLHAHENVSITMYRRNP